MRKPYEKEITGDLREMQDIVGGTIQAVYPFQDMAAIGVNINQIARKVNAGIANRNDIHELLFLMRKIEARMAKISDG